MDHDSSPHFLQGEMIFEQPIFDNFCDNFLSQTHILLLLSLSIALIFVTLPIFLYKF